MRDEQKTPALAENLAFFRPRRQLLEVQPLFSISAGRWPPGAAIEKPTHARREKV